MRLGEPAIGRIALGGASELTEMRRATVAVPAREPGGAPEVFADFLLRRQHVIRRRARRGSGFVE